MTEQLLLVLRIGFVVVLYLFIWRIVRLGVRDLRAPQESMVIGAAAAHAAGLGTAARAFEPGRRWSQTGSAVQPALPSGNGDPAR